MHALTYVLSIEIALTVTVLCREASRGDGGEHGVRHLEELEELEREGGALQAAKKEEGGAAWKEHCWR